MLQSKLKVMRTVTSESFKPSRGKPSEADCARHISRVSALMRYKLTIRDESKRDWHKLPESPMREPNEADHTEHISSMTTLMGCKLAIWNVTHHLKKGCTSNSNVESLIFLPRKVVVAATVMKKAYEKPAPALVNLIWEAQLGDACVLEIGIALDSEHLPRCEEALWEWGARGILCKNRAIYLLDDAALKAKIIKHHHDNLHVKHYTWKQIKKLI